MPSAQVSRPVAFSRAMVLSRRTVVAAAGLAVPFLPRFARAAVTWRVGHGAPVDFPLHARLQEGAQAIASRSDGQMAVEIYPNSELGSSIGVLAQVRAGKIDAVPLTGQMLGNDLPAATLPMLGFAFVGYEQLWPAIDGDTGAFLRAQIKERLDLVAMDRCWHFGFRQITTGGKPLHTVADMVGLKLRTLPEADFVGLFHALKALPVAVPLDALEQALGSRSVDGQESVLPLVQAAGLFRVQSVCALTNHIWDGQWMCVSGRSWAALPANLKDVVAAALNESALHQRQDTVALDAKVRADLEANGITFNAVDSPGFRSVLRAAGYYAGWRTRMGGEAWAALEKYTGRLT
jgi:TRAP-type transport system periplasmic protein